MLFTVAYLCFIIFPDRILTILNEAGKLAGWKGEPLQMSTERFWLVLAASLMVVLIISAIKALQNITKNIFYVKIIIISKLVSTTGFIYCLAFLEPAFAYLVGALADGMVFLITLLAYRRAVGSRIG